MTLRLSVSLLGSFTATLDETPLPAFRTKSVQALLIYLLCAAERPHQREALMALLWPEMPAPSAQANLRQTLYRLRKMLPAVRARDGQTTVPLIVSDRQSIQINPDADFDLDATAFADSPPAEAIALYRGDFLADFYLPDNEAFEAWVASRRADYRRRVLVLLQQVTAAHLHDGHYDEAVQLAQRQLQIDNLSEQGHRQLMEAWARSGRRQEALGHFEDLRRLLQAELAIEPAQETRALVESIRTDDFAAGASVPAPEQKAFSLAAADEKRGHNLPQHLTPFVGQRGAVTTVIDLLAGNRLVTLTGVGGIGKTKLSVQVGRKSLARFADGVWLVELASIRDPDLVPGAVANVLGVIESSDSPPVPAHYQQRQRSANRLLLEKLIAYLQDQNCLLILDNCEHLIDATAHLAGAVLARCPGVAILASSREALGVPGEVPFRVPPLTLPDAGQLPSTVEWQQYDALRLFAERAVGALPTFAVTEENLAALVQICRRLDGIPLALELAAARVTLLPLVEIAARLDHRFRLLTGGSRTALPRQQTLRALVDWSWDLLTEPEQQLLARLSVFAGGMSLEAVEAVCAGDGLDRYDILDLLGELVNKSLLTATRAPGTEPRYHLLETIRHYAQERLAAGESAIYRQRHLDYFVQWVEPAAEGLKGPDQILWLERLQRELDNLRAALDWAVEMDGEAGLRIIVAIWRFLEDGVLNEGPKWVEQMLAQTETVPPEIAAGALYAAGRLSFRTAGDLDTALPYVRRSLVLYREIGDLLGEVRGREFEALAESAAAWERQLRQSLALALAEGDKHMAAQRLQWLSWPATYRNEFEQAAAYLEERVSLSREIGDLLGVAGGLATHGRLLAWQGEFEQARQLLEESLAVARSVTSKLGDNTFVAPQAFEALGTLHFHQGDYATAQAYLERTLSLYRQMGTGELVPWCLARLGQIYLLQEEPARASAALAKALLQFTEATNAQGAAYALEGLARLAVRQDEPERAVRFLAWADATRAALPDYRPPIEQADVDRDIVLIREMINETTYTAAYTAGQAMTMAEIVAYALNNTPGS